MSLINNSISVWYDGAQFHARKVLDESPVALASSTNHIDQRVLEVMMGPNVQIRQVIAFGSVEVRRLPVLACFLCSVFDQNYKVSKGPVGNEIVDGTG